MEVQLYDRTAMRAYPFRPLAALRSSVLTRRKHCHSCSHRRPCSWASTHCRAFDHRRCACMHDAQCHGSYQTYGRMVLPTYSIYPLRMRASGIDLRFAAASASTPTGNTAALRNPSTIKLYLNTYKSHIAWSTPTVTFNENNGNSTGHSTMTAPPAPMPLFTFSDAHLHAAASSSFLSPALTASSPSFSWPSMAPIQGSHRMRLSLSHSIS